LKLLPALIALYISIPAVSGLTFNSAAKTDAGTLIYGDLQIYYNDSSKVKKQTISIADMEVSSTHTYRYGNLTRHTEIRTGHFGDLGKLTLQLNLTWNRSHTRLDITIETTGEDALSAILRLTIPDSAGRYLATPPAPPKENLLYDGDGTWKQVAIPPSPIFCAMLYGGPQPLSISGTAPESLEVYDAGKLWRGFRIRWRTELTAGKGNITLALTADAPSSCGTIPIPAEAVWKEIKATVPLIPAIRGGGTIYILSKTEEPFDIEIYKQDLNQYQGEDVLNLTLIFPEGQVIRAVIEDDGYTGKPGTPGGIQKATLHARGSGIYTLILQGSGDTVVRGVVAPGKKAVVSGRLFLYGAHKVYFMTGDSDNITIHWKNPWINRTISVYHDGKLIFNTTLYKTSTWRNITVRLPYYARNSMLSFKTDGMLLLGFKGVPEYFSALSEAWFDPGRVPRIPPLRGGHTLYFTSTGGELVIFKKDLNCYPGEDTLNVTLVAPDGRVKTLHVPDDGYSGDDCRFTRVQAIRLYVPEAPGAYMLKLSAGGDVLISGLQVPGSKLVISGVYFPHTAQKAYFRLNQRTFNITWKNPWGERWLTLRADGRVVNRYLLNRSNAWRRITINVAPELMNATWSIETTGGVVLRLEGADYLSFTADSWFVPDREESMNFLRGRWLVHYLSCTAPGSITVFKRDINLYPGEDVLSISLVLPSGRIYNTSLPDDGYSARSELSRTMNVSIPLGEPGNYTLVMSGNGDMLTAISTTCDAVYAGTLTAYTSSPVYFMTDNASVFEIRAASNWAAALPNRIRLYSPGGDLTAIINLSRRGKWESVELVANRSGVWTVVPEKNPYILEVSGEVLPIYSFSRSSLFVPFSPIKRNDTWTLAALSLIIAGGAVAWAGRRLL